MIVWAVGDFLVIGTRREIWPRSRAEFGQIYDAIAPTVTGGAGRYGTRATSALLGFFNDYGNGDLH